MLYNEEYVLSKIKRHEEQIVRIESRLGTIINIISSSFLQLSCGDGDPTTAPLDPAQAALYYNNLTGVLFNWNISTQTWR
jgi:hypothetical protein